ncbi:MAG: hypothetical protein H0T65_18755, partial [Deltaproteobacteria bacterium]|nr:hypothetical protein [Deltaproteobacteria bacterium]
MKFVLVLACLVGCYSPSVRDCTVSCANPNDCAGDQVCTTDGWCAAPETACMGVAPDSSMATSDGSIDARPLCELGCPNGTCVGGVCVIDCSATGSCTQDFTCPQNIPCRVVCGDQACTNKVACGLASSCEVQCNGINACADEIVCGVAPCDVTCAGAASCKKRVKCKEACSCDVACTGTGSCAETPECPL